MIDTTTMAQFFSCAEEGNCVSLKISDFSIPFPLKLAYFIRVHILRSSYNSLMTRPLALVTGGVHRLGKTFALSLARMGYDLLLHYHSAEEQAQQTKREGESLGVNVHLFKADLTQLDQIQLLFTSLDSLLLTPEVVFRLLVNSAAIMPVGNLRELEGSDWDYALDLNLRAPFLLAQEAARRMTGGGGLIVNISDIAAQKTWSRYPSYTVSKAAVESLTKLLARAFAPNIRVNAIAPGLVLQSDVVTQEEWDKLVNRLPAQRAAQPEEIASALEFLLKNEYITGQTIVVDGGYSLL
jgi:NAD(P)-dependent dehydrogenase (short-subunit alcohol dehydrogenase family)